MRHDEAADRWDSKGEVERANLERRSAALERSTAQLDRDRADVEDRQAGTP